MTDVNPLAPIELRYASVESGGVNIKDRIITVIAVPYDEPTKVEYRSELWDESFMRGSLDTVAAAPHRVRANRGHNKDRTVGKAVAFWPDRQEGCVGEIRIAKTELGDETLALADDDCLSVSVGFGVLPSDQLLDRRSMSRRIRKAYLDHISFVEAPAYPGARVLSVREQAPRPASQLEPIRTPNLDEALASVEDILRYTSDRFGGR